VCVHFLRPLTRRYQRNDSSWPGGRARSSSVSLPRLVTESNSNLRLRPQLELELEFKLTGFGRRLNLKLSTDLPVSSLRFQVGLPPSDSDFGRAPGRPGILTSMFQVTSSCMIADRRRRHFLRPLAHRYQGLGGYSGPGPHPSRRVASSSSVSLPRVIRESNKSRPAAESNASMRFFTQTQKLRLKLEFKLTVTRTPAARLGPRRRDSDPGGVTRTPAA
jgi:hypothetical protein